MVGTVIRLRCESLRRRLATRLVEEVEVMLI
jgi:hypothetical protein